MCCSHARLLPPPLLLVIRDVSNCWSVRDDAGTSANVVAKATACVSRAPPDVCDENQSRPSCRGLRSFLVMQNPPFQLHLSSSQRPPSLS